MFNTIMIILILALFFLIIYMLWRRTAKQVQPESDEFDDPYSIEALVDYVNLSINATLRRSLKDQNLSREDLEKERRKKTDINLALKQAAIGSVAAKSFIKAIILGIICNTQRKHPVTEDTIDNVIQFNSPRSMEPEEKFETLLYIYANARNKQTNKKNGANCLSVLFKEYELDKPLPGTSNYIITADDIDAVYDDVMKRTKLSYTDKRNIVAQRIYELWIGMGVVDMLLDTSVDEVQAGTSAPSADSYELKGDRPAGAKYSYESIWIVYSGLTIHLDCLSFGSQDELVRVCNNIYKYDAPNVLSKNEGKVVATMLDGSRIVVVRPPFADSYAFLARKFDSTPSLAPELLLTDKCADIPITMTKWLVRCECNTFITGDQGCGKTTYLKSAIRFIPENYTIRVCELTPELNLRYTYTGRNIMSFRETSTISMQDALDLQKKTSGIVNIIGETANAEAASWIIQVAKVASKLLLTTHHAKTFDDLIVSLRNNIMSVSGYANEVAVDDMIAKTLNADIHLTRVRGHRYLERITESVPIRDRSYPQEMKMDEDIEILQKKALINTLEYQKRMTDRTIFKGEDLVRFDTEKKRYVLVKLPSEEMLKTMASKIDEKTEKEMLADFERIANLEKEMQELEMKRA